jgi:hypothetical protein
MHHCRKFFNLLQELFAALQQKDKKPCFLIKNKGLKIYINPFLGAYKALLKEIMEQKSMQKQKKSPASRKKEESVTNTL